MARPLEGGGDVGSNSVQVYWPKPRTEEKYDSPSPTQPVPGHISLYNKFVRSRAKLYKKPSQPNFWAGLHFLVQRSHNTPEEMKQKHFPVPSSTQFYPTPTNHYLLL